MSAKRNLTNRNRRLSSFVSVISARRETSLTPRVYGSAFCQKETKMASIGDCRHDDSDDVDEDNRASALCIQLDAYAASEREKN